MTAADPAGQALAVLAGLALGAASRGECPGGRVGALTVAAVALLGAAWPALPALLARRVARPALPSWYRSEAEDRPAGSFWRLTERRRTFLWAAAQAVLVLLGA